MPCILPVLQDPTDVVLQGNQFILSDPPPAEPNWSITNMIAGEQVISNMPTFPVPRALVGQSNWYGIRPRQIGPMAFGQAGMIEMLDIGIPTFKNPNIDPTQSWLNAPFPIDSTGMWYTLEGEILGAFEATNTLMIPDATEYPGGIPVVTIPRGAVFRSGLIKRITAPVLGPTVGTHIMELFVDSTQKLIISGVTKNSSGTPLAGCRVILFWTDKIKVNDVSYGNPEQAETVSDANGLYSFQVTGGGPFQLIAYLAGSPDVAGITVNSIVPVPT